MSGGSRRGEDATGVFASGPIAWMIHNRVTPNLLMIVLIAGGLVTATLVKQEIFPDFDLDIVEITVAYPGASPAEVEQAIVLAIEESVQGLEGVDKIRGMAREGAGTVTVELLESADRRKAYQEIQQQVDRIRTFPEDAEKPLVRLLNRRRHVVTVQLYGDADAQVLRELADRARDQLLQHPGISQVDLERARLREVRIEIPQQNLRAYGLTLADVARRIDETSVEVPGGEVRTEGGEILLRFTERRDWAREFAAIPLITTAGGTVLRLRDVATVEDTFEEVDRLASYNGKDSIEISIHRVGDETPLSVSAAVREVVADLKASVPPGIGVAINSDRSVIYKQRLSLLLKNAALGLTLVLLVLGLFLEIRLSFWVTIGIPTAFLGGMIFLPLFGITINMISMFAFIIALGIVVDDAIVAGENIYERRERGMSFVAAAIQGARDVAMPISFAILSNILAFLPLLFIPGMLGKVWAVTPVVVTAVFVISWVEALFVLPAHLAHGTREPRNPLLRLLGRGQQGFSRLFMRFVERVYRPFLERCVRYRYLTVAVAMATLFIVGSYAMSGRMGFILMPKVESDSAVATVRLPFGTPLSQTIEIRDRLVAGAQAVAAERGGARLMKGIQAQIDENEIEIDAYLTAPDVRPISTAAFTSAWRERVGPLVGVQSVRYESDSGGPGRGPSVTVELRHRDIDVLDEAGDALARAMLSFAVAKDVDDGYSPGKPQLDFTLKPEGRALGLTSAAVARQVRASFYGAEALRQQRGRDEVKVMVSLPRGERDTTHGIDSLLIRTPGGRDVPLRQVAEMKRGRAYTTIERRNGQRTINVTCNIVPLTETNRVLDSLNREILPDLMSRFPGLGYSYEGRQAEMREALEAMIIGLAFTLIGIYLLLAIPFRSYTQPAVVMFAIPFSIVGAIIGHEIMGYSLSMISLFGIIALAGVVVNDALVMIDYANRRRRETESPYDAIIIAGVRRFRPILLTTLTTFGGLAPMIFETSRQARFMIPMAISLGYGIVFATAITLVITPCFYLMLEDVKRLFGRMPRES